MPTAKSHPEVQRWSLAQADIAQIGVLSKQRHASITSSGLRALLPIDQGNEHALYLWEQGLGVTLLSPMGVQVVGDAALSADGTSAVFLGIADGADGASLFVWQEGLGVQEAVARKFAGSWTLQGSPDLRSLILLPQADAALNPSSSSVPNYHGGPLRIRLEPKFEPTTGTMAKEIAATVDELFSGAAETLAARSDAIVTKDAEVHRVEKFRVQPPATADDIDGDGVSDLLVFGGDNELPLWRAQTLGGFDGPSRRQSENGVTTQQFLLGQPRAVPVSGDYNGDGLVDPATFTPNFAPQAGETPFNWFIYLTRRAEQQSGNLGPNSHDIRRLYWGNMDDLAVPADYDGDGRTDPAVFAPKTCVWSILYSGGGLDVAKALLRLDGYGDTVQFGLPGDRPVPADYDGDGKTDLAVVRVMESDQTLRWLIRRSSAAPGAPLLEMKLGRVGDLAIPADYDGDGRADAAVLSRDPQSRGVWTIRTAEGKLDEVSWCDGTGVPFTGDYDGDRRADLGCYFPGSTEPWHILLSSFTSRGRQLFSEKGPARFDSTFTSGTGLPASALLREHQLRVR